MEIKDLRDMINSMSYHGYESDHIDHICMEGAESMSHQDYIELWREYIDNVLKYELTDFRGRKTLRAIGYEIDQCERWHISHGTINEESISLIA